MAAERLPMRKLREVIRLKHAGLSGRAIARSCQISPGTISGYLGRIALAKIPWPLPPELDDDAALERLLFPDEGKPQATRPEPDWAAVHRELRRKHVTKLLLWQEYREGTPDGLQYSRFCDRYLQWAAQLSVTMRQVHLAGEKLFVDFSGDGIEVIDGAGNRRVAKLFVGVLGASNFTYVEPVFTEDLATWIGCHVRAFEFIGGVPEFVVPDNPKAGVTRADRYDPELNPTYAELAAHYGVAVVPARPRKPRDKAKVEVGVLLAERWILAVLRNRTFTSLAELREAIRPLVDALNDRPMRRVERSRRQLFEELDRPALRPLPPDRYELATWSKSRVGPDYHVRLEDHFYSVPYQLVGQRLELRATETTVEIFNGGKRVASHVRSLSKNRFTTVKEHMPKAHREWAEWTPTRLLDWARLVGPQTAALIEGIMERRAHAQHGFRAALGVMALRKRYPDSRIEAACTRAVARRTFSWRSVDSILRHGLDGVPLEPEETSEALPLHENVRGPGYYDLH